MVRPLSRHGAHLALRPDGSSAEGAIPRVLIFLAATIAAAGTAQAQDEFAATIRTLTADGAPPGSRWRDSTRYRDAAARLYSLRSDGPVWMIGGRFSPQGRAAIDELLAAGLHGIDPGDYDGQALEAMARRFDQGPVTVADLARTDVWLTISLLRYLDDLRFGRVRFEAFTRGPAGRPDWAALDHAIDGDSISRLVAASAPALTQYRNLQRLLLHYRGFATDSSPRAHQIELALERLRWLPPLGRRPFLVVNIPAFELFAFDSAGGTGAPSLAMKVVVGKAVDTRTPMLFEQMRYVEFRPFWNVPRGILRAEILPRLRRDPSYLRAHRMELFKPGVGPAGDRVDADVIRRLAADSLRVRQRPGPSNSLGLIKFAFPNAADVYMHGTPETELFAQSRRDFSHGCIRLEDPAALGAWVLRDQPGWTPDSIGAAMSGPSTYRVALRRPLAVAVFYTTAVAMPDGTARFYPDIYGLDRELTEALAGVTSPR
ncbi:MAG: L,D-transpeptidase family protein [Gemmatimonadales bacterium]